MKQLLLHLLFLGSLGFLAACSQNSSNSGSGGSGSGSPYMEGYQFSSNGCDTEKHEFSAGSEADLKKQLCEALQDEDVNKGCAQYLRQKYFEQKCSGYAWNPVSPSRSNPPSSGRSLPQPPPPPPARRNPSVNLPDQETKASEVNEMVVRKILSHMLVKDYVIAPRLSAGETEVATKISEDLQACGLTYSGPKCFDYTVLNSYDLGTLARQNGKTIFVVQQRFNHFNSDLVFVFKIETVEQKATELLVYYKLQNKRSDQTMVEYLQDSSSVLHLSTLAITNKNLSSIAKQKLNTVATLKEFYHSMQLIKVMEHLEPSREPRLDAFLILQIEGRKDLLSSSVDSEYLYSTYEFAQLLLAAPLKYKLSFVEALLKNPLEEVRQFAATEILNMDKTRTELKSLVLKALNHVSSSVRIKAIEVLSTQKLSSQEKTQILAKLSDSDSDVRAAAEKASKGF